MPFEHPSDSTKSALLFIYVLVMQSAHKRCYKTAVSTHAGATVDAVRNANIAGWVAFNQFPLVSISAGEQNAWVGHVCVCR